MMHGPGIDFDVYHLPLRAETKLVVDLSSWFRGTRGGLNRLIIPQRDDAPERAAEGGDRDLQDESRHLQSYARCTSVTRWFTMISDAERWGMEGYFREHV